jgi:hypothetical protein
MIEITADMEAIIRQAVTSFVATVNETERNPSEHRCRVCEERRLTDTQRKKAHEDPDHYRRHLRRPCLLDGRPVFAHDGEAETVTKNFDAAIPNIPGKSLIAVEVDYVPGAASAPHTHAKSAFIYAYVISGAIES